MNPLGSSLAQIPSLSWEMHLPTTQASVANDV